MSRCVTLTTSRSEGNGEAAGTSRFISSAIRLASSRCTWLTLSADYVSFRDGHWWTIRLERENRTIFVRLIYLNSVSGTGLISCCHHCLLLLPNVFESIPSLPSLLFRWHIRLFYGQPGGLTVPHCWVYGLKLPTVEKLFHGLSSAAVL